MDTIFYSISIDSSSSWYDILYIYTIIKKISLYFLIKAGYVFRKKTAAAAAVEKSNSGIAASFLFYFYNSLSLYSFY